jgi:hypothetical protein
VGFLLAMTLPALVVALTVLGVLEMMSAKNRGRRGSAMSSTGFDILQEALYPSKKHEIEQRDHEALMAEEDAEGAPPRTRIDLDKGTAHIHLP